MARGQSGPARARLRQNQPEGFLITADPETYPIIVLQDRYRGTYSGGPWLAISVADRLENGAYRVIRCLEGGPSGDDLEAQDFWANPPEWIEAAESPDQAVARLKAKSAALFEARASEELDAKIQEGLDDLEAGRTSSLEEVEAALQARFRSSADAAE